jgi:ribosome recycling factor
MEDEVITQAEVKMKNAVEATQRELAHIRTGKATINLLDGITVEYYQSTVPLTHVASLSVPDPRTIAIQPWDKSIIPVIEKAVLKSDLGLTPSNDGTVIRLPIPPLTEERRVSLVKVVKRLAEEGKIAIRNARREANESLRKAEKEGELPEDDSRRKQEKVQELTNKYIERVDELIKLKEKEIMEE